MQTLNLSDTTKEQDPNTEETLSMHEDTKNALTTCILKTLTSTEECIHLLPSMKWFKYIRKNILSGVSDKTLFSYNCTAFFIIMV